MKKDTFSTILILILCFPAISYLTKPGFFPMHDDTQVVRIAQMAKALGDGQFPVRWVADLGYGFGYPLFNFYNPLAYYFGGLLVLLGIDALVATKITFIFPILFGAVFMYFLGKQSWGRIGGLIASFFYTYVPYHAVQIYVRGSLAELWAYGLLPAIFYFPLRLYFSAHDRGSKCQLFSLLGGGMSLACLIMAHNITAIMVIPIIIGFSVILILLAERKMWQSLFHCFTVSLLIGIGFSASFWLPALVEKKYTQVDQMISQNFNPVEHFVYPDQFWNSLWGYGGSAPGRLDGMSFQIGKLHFLAVLISILAYFVFRKKKKEGKVILTSLSLFVFSILMMTTLSNPIWVLINPLSYLQFPWRFLIFASFSSSFLAGSIVILVKGRWKYLLLPTSYFLLLTSYIRFFQPKFLMGIETTNYLNEFNVKWNTSKISDEYLPKDFPVPKTSNKIVKDKFSLKSEGEIIKLEEKTHLYQLVIGSPLENRLEIKTAYFPGWQAFVNGEKGEIDYQNFLINLKIPAGEHRVDVIFSDTPARRVGNLISVGSLVLVGIIITLSFLRKTRQTGRKQVMFRL